MERRSVSLHVAGQTFRVVSSVPEADLRRLAEVVSQKAAELSPRGRAGSTQAVLLAALALAHELEEERGRRRHLERRARELLGRVVARIDAALDGPAAHTAEG